MADGSARLMSFVTQEQAEELKKKRQEEWEKVRKPNDPLGKIEYLHVCVLVYYIRVIKGVY